MAEDVRRPGRRWTIAALSSYLAIVLFLPGSLGGSIALTPLPMAFTAVAWRRDRPTRLRHIATTVTLTISALGILALIYHLGWGDLA